MAAVDPGPYLARIGFHGEVRHDATTLESLQRAHLTAVPFENLDVFHRRGVTTDPAANWSKIVDGRRGGWCYELNGAFALLLECLGFSTDRLGATVLQGEPPGPLQPDHVTLRVDLERPYLVDVGFGDSFIRPLPLDHPGPHDGGTGLFRFEARNGSVTLHALTEAGPRPCYRFDPDVVCAMGVFEPASRRLQTAAGSHWREKPFATRLVDGGPDRVVLLADRLRIRRGETWTEQPVPAESWAGTLQSWFGMEP